MSLEDVKLLLEQLGSEWPGASYDLLRRNCCHFCDDFCQKLGVGPIPQWVTNLAGAGATVDDGINFATSKAKAAAIIAAAKAGEVDEKYQIKAKAQDLLVKVEPINKQLAEASGQVTQVVNSTVES